MTKRTNGKWPDGTVRSQCNAFTQAWGGQRIDVGKLATNDRISRNATKTVVRKAKLGLNIGTIPGMSRKATEGARTRKAPK